MKTQLLKLSDIVTTAGTQIRAKIDTDTVDDYATAMLDTANKFPAVVVFHDGSQFVLADGFHRVMAANRNGFKDIQAEIHKGTRTDALKYALSANAIHGLKRTNADKHRSVVLALEEWPKVSNREIARICAVSESFARTVRDELSTAFKTQLDSAPQTNLKRIGRDGKERRLPAKKQPSSCKEILNSSEPEEPEEEKPRVECGVPPLKSEVVSKAFKALQRDDYGPTMERLAAKLEEIFTTYEGHQKDFVEELEVHTANYRERLPKEKS